jgi:hypothetical protein
MRRLLQILYPLFVLMVLGTLSAYAISGLLTTSGGGSGTVQSGTGPAIAQYPSGTGTTVGPATVSGDSTIAQGGAVNNTGLHFGASNAVSLPTTAPTSGGVPYFSSATALASSGALTVNVLTKGGGAGAAPSNSSITDSGTTISSSEPYVFTEIAAPSGTASAETLYGDSTDHSLKDLIGTNGPYPIPRVLDFEGGNPKGSQSNSISEFTMFSITLPGNLLGTQHTLECVVDFNILNNSGVTQSYTHKVYYGATAYFSANFGGGQGTNTNPVWYEAHVRLHGAGATNAQTLWEQVDQFGAAASGTGAMAQFGLVGAVNTGLTTDSTAAQTFKYTITPGASTATQTVSFYADTCTLY